MDVNSAEHDQNHECESIHMFMASLSNIHVICMLYWYCIADVLCQTGENNEIHKRITLDNSQHVIAELDLFRTMPERICLAMAA